ncbi:MAG: hypothetical protein F6J87_26510 [Spirulina sp. SIO3F2]|nr:hypothetical protein [Spirulina sp. SIO3F2]
MSGQLQHLEQLEQDLAKYRQQFRDSTEVLTVLAEIKQDFATLTQYYAQIQVSQVATNGTVMAMSSQSNGVPPTSEQLMLMQERLAYALVQLEHYVTEQALRTQDIVDQRLVAIEQSVQSQMNLFRQQMLLALTELDQQYEGYLETQLAPLEANQAALRGSLQALENHVQAQDETLQDWQTCVSDRLESLNTDINNNQNTLQWFLIGGIILSLVFLLLPLGLQLRNEAQLPPLDAPPTDVK